jgi:hypothetical protein
MAAGDIYRKTQSGTAEITNRKLKLTPRLRTMLILIEGTQPEFLMKEEGAKLGAPPDFIEQLLALGLIEKAGRATGPAPADAPSATTADASGAAPDEYVRFRGAKDFMNATIVDALGLKSFFFTLKLERAGNRTDLHALVDDYRSALTKAYGEGQADVFVRRLTQLLG